MNPIILYYEVHTNCNNNKYQGLIVRTKGQINLKECGFQKQVHDSLNIIVLINFNNQENEINH